MQLIPISPLVDSFSSSIPYDAKRIFSDKKKQYLPKAYMLQESYTVYQAGSSTGICFSMRDFGVRDIRLIGFTLIIETTHHAYTFEKSIVSVSYRNDNQFQINITGLQRIPFKKCSIHVNWIEYMGKPQTNKVHIDSLFERPKKADMEYMRRVSELRSCCKADPESTSSRKSTIPEDVLSTAWMSYSELNDPFSTIQSLIQEIQKSHQSLQLNPEFDTAGVNIVPVPISCYFDKGFYSTVYYAKNYPIIEKRFSGGKSAVQCVVGVNKEHLDVLLYLFYCTIEQRKYYQYMTDEQIALQRFLDENHPVFRLRKMLESIAEEYSNSGVVLKSDVYQEAQTVVADVFTELKAAREAAYNELVNKKQTHGQWVNEYKLFTLIRVLFPDAEYQFTAEWLEQQVLDIFIPSIQCAIEYQGEQHYQSVDYFGGAEKLAEQEKMDEMKREKCQENGVSLLEWPYSLQIHMPSVCTFLRGSVSEEYLDYERIENQVAQFPVSSLSEFLVDNKSKQTITPTEKRTRENKNEIRKYDSAGKYIRSYASVAEAAEYEDLSIGGINKVIYGERKSAGGFQWKRCAVGSPKTDIAAIER